MVLVTHDPAIGDRCGRIIRMRDGLIVGESAGALGMRGQGLAGAAAPLAAASSA